MAGKIEIYKDKKGEYRFRLKSSNGENILGSEGYKRKSSAVNGAASVEKNCADASCFIKNKTPGGKYRFNMKSRNHKVIGVSQNYNSEAACDNGIQAVARAAKGAKIVDLTQA
ncbi:MAG TPA: YegP family protein [Arenicellales bacterium]|nr:YegP family protein [Arenicellales bacterium]